MPNAPSSKGKTADFESANRGSNPRGASDPRGFVPCPLCKQYSHSIGEDQLAAAFMVFQSMFSHRNDGIPTQFCFDEKARDAAQVLMARIVALETALIGHNCGKRLPIKCICVECIEKHDSDTQP